MRLGRRHVAAALADEAHKACRIAQTGKMFRLSGQVQSLVTPVLGLVGISTSLLAWVWLVIPCPSAAARDKPPDAAAPNVRALAIVNKPWTGDFDVLVAHRMIRLLVPYSRTLFFNDKGRERGLTPELVRDFERYLNQQHRTQLGKRPITEYIVATTRDTLL